VAPLIVTEPILKYVYVSTDSFGASLVDRPVDIAAVRNKIRQQRSQSITNASARRARLRRCARHRIDGASKRE
jgi:hypothetical protein